MGDRSHADARIRPELGLPERYAPLRHIATGGMASVWCARDEALGRNVAIKLLAEPYAHDELAGWGQGGDITRQAMTLVLLRQPDEPPPTTALFEAVTAATDEVMADVVEVWAEGDDDVARFFDLVLVGELTSLIGARAGGLIG